MRLELVFDKVREDTLGIYFERACQALGIAHDHFWTRNAAAIPATYDGYLRIDHGDYQDDLPPHLRPKAFYAADTHLPKSWTRIRRLARCYDLVCCAHRDAAEHLPNGAWVPVACDPHLHRGSAALKRWDVAFVGTEGGLPRKFFLQALRERYPNSFIGHAPHTDLGAIYSQAKIGFNYSIRHDVNMRIFEVLCSGALLVTNRLRHDDLARLGLRDREHLVTYQGPRDVFTLIDDALRHEEERDAIARRGSEAVRQRHTYVHRLQRILELMAQRTGSRWSACGNPSETLSCVC